MKHDAMDDDFEDSSGNLLPIALAALGILLGCAGVYFAFSVRKDLNQLRAQMQESTTGTEQAEQSLETVEVRIADLEDEIAQQTKTLNRLRVYGSQSEQAIKKLSGDVTANRNQLVRSGQQINQIIAAVNKGGTLPVTTTAGSTSGTAAARSKPKPTSQTRAQTPVASASSAPAPAPASESQSYVVVAGDNFSKIAAKFKVPLQSLLDANDEIDPRRLGIGQTIIIPAR